MLRPLAVAIVTGLAVQLPLVPLLLPALLSLFGVDYSGGRVSAAAVSDRF